MVPFYLVNEAEPIGKLQINEKSTILDKVYSQFFHTSKSYCYSYMAELTLSHGLAMTAVSIA